MRLRRSTRAFPKMHFDFGCTFHVRRDQHYVSSFADGRSKPLHGRAGFGLSQCGERTPSLLPVSQSKVKHHLKYFLGLAYFY